MKSLSIIFLLLLVTACGMPQVPETITTNPPPPTNTPVPTPTPEPTPEPEVTPEEEIGTSPVAHDELSRYINAFETRNMLAGGKANPSTLQVVLVNDLPANILGTCTMGMSYVKINQYLWDQLTPSHREELIFHELGHCVLGRLHDNTMIGGYPASIMNAYHMGPSVYLRSQSAYQSYMAELFGVNKLIFANLSFNDSNYASINNNYASIYRGEGQASDPSLEGMEEITCPNH